MVSGRVLMIAGGRMRGGLAPIKNDTDHGICIITTYKHFAFH
jgi:hypothetical protein